MLSVLQATKTNSSGLLLARTMRVGVSQDGPLAFMLFSLSCRLQVVAASKFLYRYPHMDGCR